MKFSVFFFVVLSTSTLIFLFIDNVTINPFLFNYVFIKNVEEPSLMGLPLPLSSNSFTVEEIVNYTNDVFDTCELPQLNPWDPAILKFLKPATKKKSCKPFLKLLTRLENGLLIKTVNDSKTTCSYRCLHPINDYKFDYGNWLNITDMAKPVCDVIETKCFKNNATINSPFYEFLHAQIYRKDKAQPDVWPDLPDVHVIIIDSVSHSQFVRALPRTYYELISNYEAVQFSYLNKVAVNSRPNALAMFFGKSHRDIKKSPMSVGYESDFKKGADCRKYLDDDQFVGKFFKQANYKTFSSDDWAVGPFNWPNCKGFERKATDHMMKPFQLRTRDKKFLNKNIYNNIYRGMCRESFEITMDYLNDFIQTYSDKPKFSIIWNTDISHDDNNQLYHADEYYYNFFRKNEAQLNNSFVIIMADHGMRFGAIRKTPIGETEDNNPFLLLTLPWRMRQNPSVLATVRKNSHQLITHYDLYATYVDIAQPKVNSKLIIHGSSLLRPLPQPRTCDRLRIPFEYCMCVRRKTMLPSNNTIGKQAALMMVDHMNDVIETDSNIKNLCASLSLDETATIKVEQLPSNGNFNTYQVTYNVLPGDGIFWGYVGQVNNSSHIRIISERFPRLNSFEKTAFCAKNFASAAYCYCKSLIKS